MSMVRSMIRTVVRKVTRHCNRYGKSANYKQVSYFLYADTGKRPRKKKTETTIPQKKILNTRRAIKYFEALVHTNFGKNDLLVGLSFSEENAPANYDEARKHVVNYIKRINREREKRGLPKVKYIAVYEQSSKGRIHVHIIMDGRLDRDIVEQKWGKGYANSKRLQLDKKYQLKKLVSYLSKDPQGKRRWSPSQNLIKPWESVNDNPRMMSKKKMRFMAEMPQDSEHIRKMIELDNPGYQAIEIEKFFNEDTGQWYFYADMVRVSCANVQNFVDNYQDFAILEDGEWIRPPRVSRPQ